AVSNEIPYTVRPYIDAVIASGTCGANATWTLYKSGKMVIGGSGAMDNYSSQGKQPWAEYREQIKDVVIGKDITHVGQYAFAYAHWVNTVTFEEGSKLESIGALAFYYMLYYVKQVDIPVSVKSIGNLAFGYCEKLNTVTMGENVSVHAKAFYKTPYAG
ncbi:MAG: leucine-rich repeat protein, partial [Clostridia bacterium]|nr:leucine-rich repeat protein [Clostridia bacterium]